ncbi:unnamed protein product [Closterium sp. NIES-53]
MGVQERAERLAPKVRFWRVKCPQRHMAPFDRLPDMAHTEPCHIVVRCAVACAAHLLASRNPSHSTQAENIALLATQLVTVAATDARWVGLGWGGVGWGMPVCNSLGEFSTNSLHLSHCSWLPLAAPIPVALFPSPLLSPLFRLLSLLPCLVSLFPH